MEALLFCHSNLVLAFIVLILITAKSSALPAGFEDPDEFEQSRSLCKFERTEEVERECSPIFSSASKVKLGFDEIPKFGGSLSFENGDWVQEDGGPPFMPFDDSDMPRNTTNLGSLLKLVSFWLLGIDFANPKEDAIGFCGTLVIGISRNRTLPHQPQHWYPWFHKSPGYSELSIIFEGLYVRPEAIDGDGLMCMLGTSVYPFSEGCGDLTTWPATNGCNRNSRPPSVKDDRILLILRYPQNFTLTSRAVLGEMRSLRKKSDPKYFGNIRISSHLSYHQSSYTFFSDKPKACDSHLYQELDSKIEIFQGSNFCKIFRRFAFEKFDISVEMCNNEKNCSTLGPFLLEEEIERKENMVRNFRLKIADLHCVPGTKNNKVQTAKVSATLRAVFSREDFSSSGRSGLSGMTISAEGTWNSSSGQLCMIGCVGLEDDLDRCNSQISLALPVTLSITQRSILVGTIYSVEGKQSFGPMLFSQKLRPFDLRNRYQEYSNSYLSYQYSKIEIANAFMKRSKTSDMGTLVKDILSSYPGIENNDNFTLLSSLASTLYFHANALPEPSHGEKLPETVVVLDVLSLGKLLGRYWPEISNRHRQREGRASESSAKSASGDQKLPLNISAHLTLTGNYFSDIAPLHLEGVYDQLGGNMFLIGCRDVSIQHSQKIMNRKIAYLESKMDCLIEVIVDYSSKNTRWLKNPVTKVSIASQRNVDDPLYFRPVRLTTHPIPYADNQDEVRSRRYFEEIFRVLLLLGSISCLLNQVHYSEKKVTSIPFISLVMLTLQVLGHGLPLIMDTPVLFKWKEYHNSRSRLLPRGGKTLWFQMLDLIMKSLLLILFVSTLRLFQKVWKSRESNKKKKKPLHSDHKPREYRVFFSTLLVHMIGFLVIVAIQEMQIGNDSPAKKTNQQNSSYWGTITEEYWVLIQDWFLLPQILGNIIWQVQVKPLSKFYYIGFTISRLLIHAYDYLRDPVFSHYIHEYDLVTTTNPEFFAKSGKILMMMSMVFLLLVVHLQQSRMRT